MSIDIAGMREQYSDEEINAQTLGLDPIMAFKIWFSNAVDSKIKEPNAMTLATVDADGNADARIVLLKEVQDGGFVFFSNYSSAKGQQLEINSSACLVFNWLDLERQIRVKGNVKRYDEQKSELYFQSRPRMSQIAAWSSPQSKVIEDRNVLDQLVQETTTLFEGQEVLPKPPIWGGYVLSPITLEFWQGRSNRLHDRIKYTLKDNNWQIDRLAP